jgi:hypothetical protein
MLSDKLHQFLGRAIDSYSIYRPEDLVFFRRLFFGVFLLLGFPDFASFTANDPNLFNPPLLSLPWLLGTYPPSWLLTGITITLLVSSIAAMIGYRLRISLALFVLSFVIGKSFEYSFGMVDHDDMLYPVFAALLWLSELSPRNKLHLHRSSVYFLMAFAIAFAFWGAGIPKILTGWLHPADFKFKHTVIYYYHGLGWGQMGGWMLDNIKSHFVWESLDWLAVLFECALIFIIIRPRYFYWSIWACLLFHQFNYWALGIPFKSALIFYLLFFPVNRYPKAIKLCLILIISIPALLPIFQGELTRISVQNLLQSYTATFTYFHLICALILIVLIYELFHPHMRYNPHIPQQNPEGTDEAPTL